MTEDPLLGYAEISARTGIAVKTLRNYRAGGTKTPFPEPDDLTFPDRPRWHWTTIATWLDARPGAGVGGGRPRKTS
ncbi:MarR family transcriptional regulator [Frankia sp. AgB1.9]|uniref:helix-turn-helix transcriptional regulator n=1 Tax=unclassified Frankia TaxID=2632575 RepID=UPI001932EC1F|nr:MULTISPECIES: MarR family transcriptional regulator [unclassified Frankia]MBL7487337.1 MarR family transcriptional regulator [Frankia sp. AgW1.1]MBL7546345.1 MarR family transcriptional regulator [Frankia sp. AgB1.9]MBL7618609.1 MarR family transcriptional regulator [Frankia sp. AgB1.8]